MKAALKSKTRMKTYIIVYEALLLSGREKTLGCKLILYQQFYNYILSFVGLKTFVDENQHVFKRLIISIHIIIGDVHKFFVHCLIPEDILVPITLTSLFKYKRTC